MTIWDDLRKLLSGPTLFRLDTVLAGRLVPIFYFLGLVAVGLWAVDHLFASFAYNFGQGLWGILEIIVYGPLWLLALRIISEVLLVFFKAHEASATAVGRTRGGNSLIDDVGEAIHDLATDDDDHPASATDPAPFASQPAVRRTAKRTPALKT